MKASKVAVAASSVAAVDVSEWFEEDPFERFEPGLKASAVVGSPAFGKGAK